MQTNQGFKKLCRTLALLLAVIMVLAGFDLPAYAQGGGSIFGVSEGEESGDPMARVSNDGGANITPRTKPDLGYISVLTRGFDGGWQRQDHLQARP